jgi:hypothetical protein
MAPTAIILSGVSAAHSIHERDYIGAVIDGVSVIPGAGGALRASRSAEQLGKATAEGLAQQRLVIKLGKASSDRWAAGVQQAKEEANQLHVAGRKNDAVAAGIASGGAIRTAIWGHPEHKEPNPLEYHDDTPPQRLNPVRLTPVHP